MDQLQIETITHGKKTAIARQGVCDAFSYADSIQLDSDMQFLRLSNISLLAGAGKSSIRRWVADGSFPKPEPIGPQAVGWRRSEYEFWAVDPPTWPMRYFLRELQDKLHADGEEAIADELADMKKTIPNLSTFTKVLDKADYSDWANELRVLLDRY